MLKVSRVSKVIKIKIKIYSFVSLKYRTESAGNIVGTRIVNEGGSAFSILKTMACGV